MRRLSARSTILISAGACYALALWLPAFSYVPFAAAPLRTENMPGWLPLIFGVVASIFSGPAAFSFFANFTFFVAAFKYSFGKTRDASQLAAVSMVVGASFFPISFIHPVLIPFSGPGETLNHPQPKIGFWLWMAAFLIVFLGAKFSKARKTL